MSSVGGSFDGIVENLAKVNTKLNVQKEHLQHSGHSYIIIQDEGGKKIYESSDSFFSMIAYLFKTGVKNEAAKEAIKQEAHTELSSAIDRVIVDSESLKKLSTNLENSALDAESYNKQLERLSAARLALKGTIDKISQLASESGFDFNSASTLEAQMQDIQTNLDQAQKKAKSLGKEAREIVEQSKIESNNRLPSPDAPKQKDIGPALKDLEQKVVNKMTPSGFARLTPTEQDAYHKNVKDVIAFNADRIAGELTQAEISNTRLLELAHPLAQISVLLEKIEQQSPGIDLRAEKEKLKKNSSELVQKAQSNFSTEMDLNRTNEEYRTYIAILKALQARGLADVARDSAAVREAISKKLTQTLDNKITPLKEQASKLALSMTPLHSEVNRLSQQEARFNTWPDEVHLHGDVSVIRTSEFLNLLKKFQKYFSDTPGVKQQNFPALFAAAKALGINIRASDTQEVMCQKLSAQITALQESLAKSGFIDSEREILKTMRISQSPSAMKAEMRAWKSGTEKALKAIREGNAKAFADPKFGSAFNQIEALQKQFMDTEDLALISKMQSAVASLFENSEQYETYCKTIVDTLEKSASDTVKAKYDELKKDTNTYKQQDKFSDYLREFKDASLRNQRFLLSERNYEVLQALEKQYEKKQKVVVELLNAADEIESQALAQPDLIQSYQRNANRSEESLIKEMFQHSKVKEKMGETDLKAVLSNPQMPAMLKQIDEIATVTNSVALRANLLSLKSLDAQKAVDKEKKELQAMLDQKEKDYRTFLSQTIDAAEQSEKQLKAEVEAAAKQGFAALYAEVGSRPTDYPAGAIALKQMSYGKANEGLQLARAMVDANSKLPMLQSQLATILERYQQTNTRIAELQAEKQILTTDKAHPEAFEANLQGHIDAVRALTI